MASGLLAPSQELQTREDFGCLEPANVPWVRTAAGFKQNAGGIYFPKEGGFFITRREEGIYRSLLNTFVS